MNQLVVSKHRWCFPQLFFHPNIWGRFPLWWICFDQSGCDYPPTTTFLHPENHHVGWKIMVGQDVCLMPFLFSPHQPFEKTGPKPQVLLQVSSRLIPKQGCSRLVLCLLEHRISSEGHSIFMGIKGTMMVNNPLVRPVFSGVALGGV